MPGWCVEGFDEFFRTLWGWEPFAWQRALVQRVLGKDPMPWPEAIALPTAAGKTACIDIAVFSLAARSVQANGTWTSDAPRRVFFTVDRRVIVNEAFERARAIVAQLRGAKEGILFDVAERLRNLAGGDIPLMCFQLRGGMYRSDAWARSPLQPAIIATTVDQVGSRLLFRAYGRSSKAWPIQAGLASNDALILLDEAHCSQPFMETLHAIRRYRQWAKNPISTPFHVSIMSATPPDTLDAFRDLSDEPRKQGHPLGARQLAVKAAELKEVKTVGKTARETLAKELAAQVEALVNGRPVAAVVFVNYVATAREVHRLLASRHGQRAILLTGRMRPIDKDDIVSEHLKRYQLSSSQSPGRNLSSPVFVVATQTLEVGADLDFDILVTECASLDALRQRFGRLNRMGRPIETRAAILMRSDLVKSSGRSDPVYGESTSETWKWLAEEAGCGTSIDMGIARLGERLPSGDRLKKLNRESPHAPIMLPAHVDCWGQTMPEPFPSPDVGLFLHGPGRVSADVQVCWREDIDLSEAEAWDRSLDTLTLCPPSAAETLAVPIWAMRRWMVLGKTPTDEISDMEGVVAELMTEALSSERSGSSRQVVRWRGREDAIVTDDPGSLRPGDVLVLPATVNGWKDLGDIPISGELPVLDCGDRAYTNTRGKAMLRLHPQVIATWPECSSKRYLGELTDGALTAFEEDPDNFMVSLREALHLLAADDEAPDWLRAIAASLRDEALLQRNVIAHPLGKGVILRGRSPMAAKDQEIAGETVDWFSDEDDASASGTTCIALEAHLKGVAAVARRFATGCGLPEGKVSAMEQAGRLHDLGKADPRFQALLRGGNPWARGKLLAKSEYLPQGRRAFDRARRAAGYPEGGRHELLSVRMAESTLQDLPIDLELRELVLHLLGSHHGHCRPFAPVVIDPSPQHVALDISGLNFSAQTDTGLERLDSGVSERFWRLTRRYGWWGLAWLETIFRLADHRQSEREEKERRAKR